MKANRIYKYIPTPGERKHKALVAIAKNNGFKNPGTKSMKQLHTIAKKRLSGYSHASLAALRRMFGR